MAEDESCFMCCTWNMMQDIKRNLDGNVAISLEVDSQKLSVHTDCDIVGGCHALH